MNNNFLISCLVVIILATSVTACINNNETCNVQRSEECCSLYCRVGKCINYGDSADDKGSNPCEKAQCSPDESCVLRQVQCFRFPCPPIASCVKLQNV